MRKRPRPVLTPSRKTNARPLRFDDRMLVDASAALSWRMYKMAQARVELPTLARSRLTVGAQVRWQDLTQVSYFGNGPDSLETNRSEYRLESANVIGYVVGKPANWLSINASSAG